MCFLASKIYRLLLAYTTQTSAAGDTISKATATSSEAEVEKAVEDEDTTSGPQASSADEAAATKVEEVAVKRVSSDLATPPPLKSQVLTRHYLSLSFSMLHCHVCVCVWGGGGVARDEASTHLQGLRDADG